MNFDKKSSCSGERVQRVKVSVYPYKSSHEDYFQIGAHIGNSHNDPLFLLPLAGKSVILVEPVPFLYRLLKHNYRGRIQECEIEFLNIAVSNVDGTIDMFARV